MRPSRVAASSTSWTWAQPPGQRGHRHLLGVGVDPGPEGPADRRDDHPDLLGPKAEHLGDGVPCPERRLAGGVQGDAVALGLGHGHGGVGLDRGRGHPLVDEPSPDHHLGPLQGPRRLRPAALLGQVAGPLEQLRGVGGQGGPRVGEDLERLVVDLDGLGRVQGLGPGLGHHHRHRLAQEADGPGGQHRAGHGGRPVPGRQRRQAQVGGGVHAGHPGHGGGRGRVDPEDPAVGQRGPDEHGVQRPRRGQVVAVAGRPGDQGRVLAPEGGAVAARAGHGQSLRHRGITKLGENRCQKRA
jgi:hypothetical protein